MELVSSAGRCIGCNECIHGCPQSALTLTGGELQRDLIRCSTCLNCVEICPSLAHEAFGYHSEVDTIMTEIEKDLPFLNKPGGGVTFSGGEPLMQPKALIALLQRCGELDIHRTVDTAGFAPAATLLEVAEHTDLFLFDLKHMDRHHHEEYTGVSNEGILENLLQLAHSGAAIRVRIPLLTGINDSEENIRATARFAATLPSLQSIDILPYHHMTTADYERFQAAYRGRRQHCPDAENIIRVQKIFEEYGHKTSLGG